jgi:long-chain acyl-CoA synthetase
MNVVTNLERSAFYFKQRMSVVDGSSEMTYGQLNEDANKVATALMKKGVAPGDYVGLCAHNSYRWLVFFFGVLKAGGVAVCLSPLLKKDELDQLMIHSQPSVLFTTEDKLDQLQDYRKAGFLKKIICPGGDDTLEGLLGTGVATFQAVDRERTDTAVILYTGGTTGVPKGVMLSHENINASIQTVVYNERSTENDRALCFLPFNHVFGLMHIANATILSAGCLELLPAFDLEKVMDILGRGNVTKLYCVPTIFVRLLSLDRLKERLGSVRYCFSAAASMAAEHVRKWKTITGLSIYEGYGMTEAAPCVTYNHRFRHVVGSVGTEVWGVELQLRDESGNIVDRDCRGEICVRGRNITSGYLKNPEATEEAFWDGGWFRSGDVGLLDEDGYLYIVDRIKDMVITGGENVYPREVEEVLYTLPEIQECAVIGVPDQEWGEKVAAYLIPKPGERIDPKAVKAFLKEHLSAFKVPKEYRVVEDLPRSPAGKILKRELREKAREG